MRSRTDIVEDGMADIITVGGMAATITTITVGTGGAAVSTSGQDSSAGWLVVSSGRLWLVRITPRRLWFGPRRSNVTSASQLSLEERRQRIMAHAFREYGTIRRLFPPDIGGQMTMPLA